MAGLFKRFAPGTTGSTSPSTATPSKKKGDKDADPEPEITPLVRMLQHAGPIRPDGSDKFFGMENFGNTCYCNSIVQALYYSTPFRENVVRYPPHSPLDTPNGHPPKLIVPTIRPQQNGGAVVPATKPKGISAAEALKRRAAINAGQPLPPGAVQRPEDKPDSPEYKKKHAMMTGPILELTYDNASSYGMEESTFTALKDIFMALIANSSRTGVLSPTRFLEIFKRDNEMFRTSMHQDAHEFYGLVLNAVISNVEANAQRMRELEPPRDDDSLTQSMKAAVTSALGFANGTKSPGTGWVHDIFEGVLTSETKCLTCETASQRDETFLDLSIDLDEHSSVTSCLKKFSAEEMLCERNKFHCDNCGGLQEAEKRMKIKKLPKILALHLKRFKYTEDMTRLQKLFHRVVYPYHLRMFNTTDDAEDPDRLYELYAVVIHIGTNAYHGHYVSVIKTQDRGWLLFDDEMVEPVDKSYVRNFFGDKPGQACAYVLFYQETTVEAMRKEQEAEGLAEVALASEEAGIALHSQPNGAHSSFLQKPGQVAGTPTEEHNGFASLDHAVSSPPIPASPIKPARLAPSSFVTSPVIPPIPVTSPISPEATKVKSKEEKEREKKESKEAEKARKVALKEKEKADEKRRKEQEAARKEQLRAQVEEHRKAAEETRKAILLSKQTAEEEERKRKEALAPASSSGNISFADNGDGNHSNGHGHAPGEKDSKSSFGLGSLSRNHKGSKSMSKKSFSFLSGGKSDKTIPIPEDTGLLVDREKENKNDTAVEGENGGTQTPEKHDKSKKERFSFSGLGGRKKSNLTNS